MARNLEQLQKEYGQMCVKAGNLQYQIYALSKDLALLNQSMQDINIESTTLPKEEPAAQPELKVVSTEGVSNV